MPIGGYRLSYEQCRSLLRQRLIEPPPGRIQLLAGPRQVGKTTLLLDLAAALGAGAIYLAGDGPEAALPGAWERLWTRVEDAARAHGRAVVLLDEVQHVHDWASRLKAEWDRVRRRRVAVHIVASGSSSLHLGRGSRESLAGRSAPPKLVTLNNALLAAVDPRGIPDPLVDPARFGACVENACLAHAWNCGQQVAYWREEPFDVDGVLDGSWGKWAVEVKSGLFGSRDLRGLFEFVRRFRAYRPLVLCRPEERITAERAGVDAIDWRDFLLKGPPG